MKCLINFSLCHILLAWFPMSIIEPSFAHYKANRVLKCQNEIIRIIFGSNWIRLGWSAVMCRIQAASRKKTETKLSDTHAFDNELAFLVFLHFFSEALATTTVQWHCILVLCDISYSWPFMSMCVCVLCILTFNDWKTRVL